LFIYFTYVLASVSATAEGIKQGYGLDRKRTWKRGIYSGVAKGGGKWGYAPRGAGLGAHQHTFFSHLRTRFKQKFRAKYA